MIRLCAVSLALLGCLASTARAQQARVYMSWADIAHERYTVADSLCRESIESKAELMGAGGYFRFSAPGDRTLDKQLRRKAVAVALHDSLFVNSSLWNMERRYTYAERMGDRVFFASRYRVNQHAQHLDPLPEETSLYGWDEDDGAVFAATFFGGIIGGLIAASAVYGDEDGAGKVRRKERRLPYYFYMVDLMTGALHPLHFPDEMCTLLEPYPDLLRRYKLEHNYRRGHIVAAYLSEWFELEKRRLAETE